MINLEIFKAKKLKNLGVNEKTEIRTVPKKISSYQNPSQSVENVHKKERK